MKIHDKFVIELSEVIKGFGNDYRVKEPANLPCDYKFYEIGGVAICEESVKKMKPLNEEINKVLEAIKSEIEQDAFTDVNGSKFTFINRINQIIDKYKEGEGK